MKQECGHSEYKKQKQERNFQDEVFSYMAETCQECGAVLWNDRLQKNFNGWLNDLHKTKRHLFQIQYNLSANAVLCIEKLGERFPAIDQSLLIRALVMVNLDIVEGDEKILKLVEGHVNSPDYRELLDGSPQLKKIQFKPNGMQDILAYSNMLKVRPSKIVEESIYRILLLSIKTDPVMKEFWEETIIKSLETILKAA